MKLDHSHVLLNKLRLPQGLIMNSAKGDKRLGDSNAEAADEIDELARSVFGSEEKANRYAHLEGRHVMR